MLRGLVAIIYKEMLQVRRDPSTRFIFLIPVIQTLIFGLAIDLDVQHVRSGYCDMDRSVESRRLLERLANTGSFDLVEEAASPGDLMRGIVAGRVRVGFVIPPDFAANIASSRQATLQVLIDGSDSTVATAANQTSRAVSQLESLSRQGIDIAHLPIEARPRVLFNPDLESSHFYVPGLIGIILQVVTVMLTSFAVVRERERGTLEQLVVTPVSRVAIIIGKIVPYAVIGILQTILVLLLMRLGFGVPIEGDLFLLMCLSTLFLLPALSLGILVSTFSRNQAEAMQLGMLIMLPSVLLSGFAFPRESMPLPIYYISCGIPVTYYVQIARGIILRGAGLWALWPQTLILSAFTVVLVTLSSLRFHKRMT